MRKNIAVSSLCLEFEQALMDEQLSEDCLSRYRKVLSKFSFFAGDKVYSQSLGIDFLITIFHGQDNTVLNAEYSKDDDYYFKCIRMLAEYFNFGILHRRTDIMGEIIWPEPFRNCTENFLDHLLNEGLSYGFISSCRRILKDLMLFLDANEIQKPLDIKVIDNDKFIKTYWDSSSSGIARKLCVLRRYYRYLYLNEYITIQLAEKLPNASIQGRMKFPTLWTQEQIGMIKKTAERVSPSGKRGYAMILLAANLGLRIGDIRNLKLHDIDWNSKQISIIQNKTSKSLCLPLTDDVGWAIIDYLKNGRPITVSQNVFVRHVPPYSAFPINSSLNYIISSVMVKANIPPEKKEKVGWHTFRRSLATNLLQSNVEISTISDILGHRDPDIAGKYYIQIDIEHLKKCVLDIEVKDYVKSK